MTLTKASNSIKEQYSIYLKNSKPHTPREDALRPLVSCLLGVPPGWNPLRMSMSVGGETPLRMSTAVLFDPFGSPPELRKLNSTQYEVGPLPRAGCSPFVGGGSFVQLGKAPDGVARGKGEQDSHRHREDALRLHASCLLGVKPPTDVYGCPVLRTGQP